MKSKTHNLKNKVFLLLLMYVTGVGKAQTLDDSFYKEWYYLGDTVCDSAYSISHFQKTWPMPGAEWTYCLYSDMGDAYAKEVWQVTGDSLIGNHDYDVIQPVDSFGYPVANSGKILLTRYENDTVYRFANNKEYLFFVFELNEGDVFTTFRSAGWGANGVPNYGNDSACCSLKPLLVTQKNEVEYDGIVLNEYILKDTLFTSLYGLEAPNMYWKMVDRIGPVDTYPLVDLKETGYHDGLGFCNYTSCSPYALLSAYRDDSFEQVWFVCHPTSVAESSLDEVFEMYPNPTTGLVHIDGVECAKVQVYNALGQQVKTVQNTNEVSLVGLPQGVYLLRVTLEDGKVFSEKVVKE